MLVDGERINACLALAVQYQGREIVTVEGLADGDGLHRAAGRVRRARRLPVRLLHAGAALLGDRHGRRVGARGAEPRSPRILPPRPLRSAATKCASG